MILNILKYAVPFVLPFVLYFIWVFIERRRKAVGGWETRDTPWIWLSIVGLALLIVALLGTGLLIGTEPGGTYVPPYIKDGEVIPGRIK
tara:strand:+ start:776 stop:1042 length:267 start_codon:yes stop_codon:yes gene_type:complete